MFLQLVLIGAPGSGKGTQAKKLVAEMDFKHVSSGDLLRAEVESKSELGTKVKAIIEAGALVDDFLVLKLLKKNCNTAINSYIFDGYPRTIEQAKALDAKVLKGATKKVIYLEVDFKIIERRVVNRRTCNSCGAIYNLIFSPPRIKETCDLCGNIGLSYRDDDSKKTVIRRLKVFGETISPVLEYYEKQGLLVRIDGSANVVDIYNKIKEQL